MQRKEAKNSQRRKIQRVTSDFVSWSECSSIVSQVIGEMKLHHFLNNLVVGAVVGLLAALTVQKFPPQEQEPQEWSGYAHCGRNRYRAPGKWEDYCLSCVSKWW